ncbi:MAG: hypothetical protein IPL96_02780 [Holophagaceae bacterium]|nr:hypothetical protein [Holophagaceae bacterium]
MPLPYVTELVLGGILCLAFSGAAIRWLAPRGWMDAPDERKQHPFPTPLTGGLALWAALAAGQVSGLLPLPLTPLEWTAVHAMALMGALDDRLGLRARYKALVGLLVAVVLGWSAAQGLAGHGDLVRVAYLELPNRVGVTMPLAVLWFWGIPQAFNLIDGLDGLALGLSALLLSMLVFGGGTAGSLLFGAVLAALVLNYPRARHFIGDTGAFLLGTLLAVLALKRALPGHPNLALWFFAYPMVDITLVVAIRLIRRYPLAVADHNHLHDWMLARLAPLPRGRTFATPLLLLLAMGPMLHEMPWPRAQLIGMGGLLLLFAVALDQFQRGLREPRPKEREPGVQPKPVGQTALDRV